MGVVGVIGRVGVEGGGVVVGGVVGGGGVGGGQTLDIGCLFVFLSFKS